MLSHFLNYRMNITPFSHSDIYIDLHIDATLDLFFFLTAIESLYNESRYKEKIGSAVEFRSDRTCSPELRNQEFLFRERKPRRPLTKAKVVRECVRGPRGPDQRPRGRPRTEQGTI